MDAEQIIEAILFVEGEPQNLKRLSQLTGLKKQEVETAIAKLEENLAGRGIRLLKKGDVYTLVTAPEAAGIIESIAKENLEGGLSRQALETLAIILWHGEATRSAIDYIRGVNSSYILKSLLMRGLVERIPHKKDSRMFVYKPTVDLMKFLGITSLEELPEYNTIKKKIEEHEKIGEHD